MMVNVDVKPFVEEIFVYQKIYKFDANIWFQWDATRKEQAITSWASNDVQLKTHQIDIPSRDYSRGGKADRVSPEDTGQRAVEVLYSSSTENHPSCKIAVSTPAEICLSS
ncbi:hypothetical protein ETB97_007192 [Aspergillus alliaceus]|uniref:Uncharacterized protein n=1 Tax=Petromyces alliaceus TaxID=209559 RepID=A0A8H6AD97_PETAA|nr:hypothetical protein ETB97_007192 [Aspergillus burnettii]